MHGTKASNYGVSECDLLIAVGVRFSDRVIGDAKRFASNAKILQFDVDPAEINKNIQTDASVIGDIKEILKRVNHLLEQQEHTEWMQQISEFKEKYPLTYKKRRIIRTVCYGGDLSPDKGRCHHCYRGGTAPDVGGAVL